MTVWDEGRVLVSEGESQTALDLVEAFLKGGSKGARAGRARTLLEDVVMLRARSRRLADKVRRGTLTASETDVERARIDQAILGLVDEIERMDQLRPPTVSISLSDESMNEKLMGSESHLRSTGRLGEGLRLATAVCRLASSQTLGTGFRCRKDLILTNHHVIQTREAANSFRAEFLFEENAAGAMQVPLTIGLEPQRLFWTSKSLDVTLVGLSQISSDDIAVIPLTQSVAASVGDHVSIIQHPPSRLRSLITEY
jgi:endonuclease G